MDAPVCPVSLWSKNRTEFLLSVLVSKIVSIISEFRVELQSV